jgi:hypothetical protein
VAVRTQKAPVRRACSKDDLRLLTSMARKEPLPKIAKALKRTEGATRHKATMSGASLALSSRKRNPAKKVEPYLEMNVAASTMNRQLTSPESTRSVCSEVGSNLMWQIPDLRVELSCARE